MQTKFNGWICLGSANFDRLSLYENLELDLATSHPEPVRALVDELFRQDFERAFEMAEPLPTDWSDYLAERIADRL